LDFFEERSDNIKYEAMLAWHLATEIDPYSVIHKRKNHQDSLDFLVSSSRLNVALPNTPDPKYKKWKGYIEELHIPHGGVIRLTDSKAMHLAPVDRQRVYFHRSRLVVNGVKLSNNDILDEEVAVGDHVQVDLIINQIDLTSAYVSQIPNVYWVGLSVKANVAERGTNIANRLRSEVAEKVVPPLLGFLKNNRTLFLQTIISRNNSNSFFNVGYYFFFVFRVSFQQYMKRKFAKEDWCI